jgi:outer membrane protein TolC
LPSISISAALADAAASPGSALLTDPVWSLLCQLTVPLFKGGKLRAEVKVAEFQTEQSYQAYRETLHKAVQEIENTIGQERSLANRQKHIKTAFESARRSLKQYQLSYRTGLVEILDLLTIEQKTYDLEIQLNEIINDRLANRTNLGLALGLGVKKRCGVCGNGSALLPQLFF